MRRVLKPSGSLWVAIGDEHAAEMKITLDRLGFTMRNWIIWHYTFGVNCTKKFNRSHAHLFYYVMEKILERVIQATSNEGDLVLDPFAGSGTTLAVAKRLKRRFIGCELSIHYAIDAQRRVNKTGEELLTPSS